MRPPPPPALSGLPVLLQHVYVWSIDGVSSMLCDTDVHSPAGSRGKLSPPSKLHAATTAVQSAALLLLLRVTSCTLPSSSS